jgi:hypothetical protein
MLPRLSDVQCVCNGYPATLVLLMQRCDLRLCEAFGWCSRGGRPWPRGLGVADAEVQRAAGVADHLTVDILEIFAYAAKPRSGSKQC